MNIKLMDCTLRDGGYKNNWEFNIGQIIKIIASLNSAKIDYIECGYLTFNSEKKKISTKFSSLDSFNNMIYEIAPTIHSELFLMIEFNGINKFNLADKNSNNQYLDGIRLAFHKQDYSKITDAVKNIASKGYKLSLQPMVTNIYSDSEILQLIELINDLPIEAFYIVDSFGNMNFKELIRLFTLIDKSLNPSISIGFHPHNNLQFAYANSIQLFNINTARKVIIDASVSGIGRGAGNLNTEIILNHLKNNNDKDYDLIPVLEIIDDVLSEIFPEKDFRNSVSLFLAAVRGCHPSYPAFFASKKYLKITSINHLINNIDEQNLNFFNAKYAEQIVNYFVEK